MIRRLNSTLPCNYMPRFFDLTQEDYERFQYLYLKICEESSLELFEKQKDRLTKKQEYDWKVRLKRLRERIEHYELYGKVEEFKP